MKYFIYIQILPNWLQISTYTPTHPRTHLPPPVDNARSGSLSYLRGASWRSYANQNPRDAPGFPPVYLVLVFSFVFYMYFHWCWCAPLLWFLKCPHCGTNKGISYHLLSFFKCYKPRISIKNTKCNNCPNVQLNIKYKVIIYIYNCNTKVSDKVSCFLAVR